MGIFDGKQILNASVTSDKMAEDVFANMPIASSDEVLTNGSAGLKTNLSLVSDGSDMVLYGRDNIELGRVNIAIGNIQNAYYDSANDEIVIVVVVQGGTDEIRIPADDLIDIYTGKEYIDVDNNNVISLNYELVKDQLIIDGVNTGINISDYYTSLQVNSLLSKYLPLEGGTVMGDLTIDGQLFYEGKRIYVEENIDEILTPGTYYIAASPTTIGGTLPTGFDPIQSSVLLVYSVGTTNGYKQVLYNNTRHFSRSIGTAGTPAAWYEYARTNDLASYLPLNGGAMKGNLQLNNNQLQLGTSSAQRLALDTQANAVELRSELSGGLKLTSTVGNLALSTPNNNIATYKGKEIATLDDVDNSRQFNTDEVTALKYGLSNGDGFYYDLTTSTGATNWTAELFYSGSEGRTGSSNLIVPSVNATTAGLVPAAWYTPLNNIVTGGGNYVVNKSDNPNFIKIDTSNYEDLPIDIFVGPKAAITLGKGFGVVHLNSEDIIIDTTEKLTVRGGNGIVLGYPSYRIGHLDVCSEAVYFDITNNIELTSNEGSTAIKGLDIYIKNTNNGNIDIGDANLTDNLNLQGDVVLLGTEAGTNGAVEIGNDFRNVKVNSVSLDMQSVGNIDIGTTSADTGDITMGNNSRNINIKSPNFTINNHINIGPDTFTAFSKNINIGGYITHINGSDGGLNIGVSSDRSEIAIGAGSRPITVNSSVLQLQSIDSIGIGTANTGLGTIAIGNTDRAVNISSNVFTVSALEAFNLDSYIRWNANDGDIVVTSPNSTTINSGDVIALSAVDDIVLNSVGQTVITATGGVSLNGGSRSTSTVNLNGYAVNVGTATGAGSLSLGNGTRNIDINYLEESSETNTIRLGNSSTTIQTRTRSAVWQADGSGFQINVVGSEVFNLNYGASATQCLFGGIQRGMTLRGSTMDIGVGTSETGAIKIGNEMRSVNINSSKATYNGSEIDIDASLGLNIGTKTTDTSNITIGHSNRNTIINSATLLTPNLTAGTEISRNWQLPVRKDSSSTWSYAGIDSVRKEMLNNGGDLKIGSEGDTFLQIVGGSLSLSSPYIGMPNIATATNGHSIGYNGFLIMMTADGTLIKVSRSVLNEWLNLES